ncbi:hypothetical protein JO972_16725 [Verrucomicrobiaceae bacterium 5K15]|uniref:Uncharacterized protein n=1 Tax=Oceaniferula flava TaxID=2800421 RepID=A0AAE2SHR9_9BACT|nr:hypothetical protein [Oceaniferula flavus]MBK1856611.1 hypothetical protein [Oceaniferula flavus]MBM1137919.1 hypothetical protein [Oceaniferula flavus]
MNGAKLFYTARLISTFGNNKNEDKMMGKFDYEIIMVALVGLFAAIATVVYERFTSDTKTHFLRLFTTTPILGLLACYALWKISRAEPRNEIADEVILMGIFIFSTLGNFFALIWYLVCRKVIRIKSAEQGASSDAIPSVSQKPL